MAMLPAYGWNCPDTAVLARWFHGIIDQQIQNGVQTRTKGDDDQHGDLSSPNNG